jgi:hypothetical protein
MSLSYAGSVGNRHVVSDSALTDASAILKNFAGVLREARDEYGNDPFKAERIAFEQIADGVSNAISAIILGRALLHREGFSFDPFAE